MSQASHHISPVHPHDLAHDLTGWQVLLDAVRDAFPARLDNPNPSLALTRVLIETAAHLDIHLRPTPVFLDITRGTGTHAHREGGIDERALLDTPFGWAGHLIAIAPTTTAQPGWLLDVSSDRFDRPIRNLLLGAPHAIPLTHSPRSDRTPLARTNPRPGDDTTITYRPVPSTHPGRDGWQHSPWWHTDTDASTTARRAAEAAAIATIARRSTPTGTPTGRTYDTTSSLPKNHPKAG